MPLKNITLQIFLLLSYLFKENLCELVIIPFESSPKNGISSTETPFSFIDEIFNTALSTYIKIGTPEIKIKTFIAPSHSHLYIKPSDYTTNSDSEYDYVINKSETFKNISKLNLNDFYGIDTILAQEKFKFQAYNYTLKKYSEISLDELNFILAVKKDYNFFKTYNLYIGLNPDKEFITSIVHEIKKKSITNNYYFNFCYYYSSGNNNLLNNSFLINTKYDLIIGEPLHKFKPDSFYENQLIKINTLKDEYGSYKNSWVIRFTKIFFYSKNNVENNITLITDTDAFIYFDEYLIISNYEYNKKIEKDFFDDYKNDCFTNNSGEYLTYYCQKSENFTIENLKKFPKIFFQHNDLNYTFILDYQDLFVEKNGKFWFLIVFESYYELNQWFLGNLFLRKYNFTFDIDNKLIGFYNPNLPKTDNNQKEEEKENNGEINKINNDNKMNYWLLFGLVAISGIVFISVGIFIGKKVLNKVKKKRANELLDDNYEYKTSDDISGPIVNN